MESTSTIQLIKALKLRLAYFAEKHPLWLFVASCLLQLGYFIITNLVNLWGKLQQPNIIKTPFFDIMAFVMLITGGLMFPFGIVMADFSGSPRAVIVRIVDILRCLAAPYRNYKLDYSKK